MANIGIVDAELLMRGGNHNFPNLACMKISSWHKNNGDDVSLITDTSLIHEFDKVYVSKVFTDTPNVPGEDSENVVKGGTGYYFDKAEPLSYEIEHSMPDYHLYAGLGLKGDYTNTSIGYLTRGCFRKCGFCVNQKYDHVFRASELEEFFDKKNRTITLLDDNFFGFPGWRSDLEKLIDTGHPFRFKQGLDERLLTEEKWKMLISAKYAGDYTFAFDRIQDYDLIRSKIEMMRKISDTDRITYYVLCGYDGIDINDIVNTFKRVELLRKNRMFPYIMRMQTKDSKPYLQSEWKSIYVVLAMWCNQRQFFRHYSLRDFVLKDSERKHTETCYLKSLNRMLYEYPELRPYTEQKFGEGAW